MCLGEGLPKRCTWVCKVGGTLLKQLLRWRLWVWELVHVPGMGMEVILCVPAMKMGQATTGETSTIQNISKLEVSDVYEVSAMTKFKATLE